MTEPGINEVVAALRPLFQDRLRIREVRGVRLKSGRELLTQPDQAVTLYAEGIHFDAEEGVNFWEWDQISEVLV
jgi:hypothetical protein